MAAARVLVVDDLPFMRKVIREILQEAGDTYIVEAENGQEGLRIYQQFKPDLVLLDIVMPVLDGITTLERLIRLDPAARVVMCSALGQEELIVHAIQIGARDFIVKPFLPDRLVSAVRKALVS
ncbi:MAG TPA: response regulator [Spirochaetales bacterium]|nr:response regulator [Spirochaetales bacterium]